MTLVRCVKKDTDVNIVRHLMNIVLYIQKYENVIHLFTWQLFVSVLPKNIAQSVS